MSWEVRRLGDLLLPQPNGKVLQQGWSPRCIPTPATAGSWGVLKTTAIQDGRFEAEHNKELPEHLSPRDKIEVRAGDLLMTCAGPRARCGVPALVRNVPPRLMMSGKMYRFRPKDCLLVTFLELWLRSPEAQRRIDAMKTGISESGLNLTHDRFVELPVPVPPLEDQQRIVELLEDHLSRLDAAEAGLARARRLAASLQEAWLRSLPSTPAAVPEEQWLTLREVLVDVRGGWSRSARHMVSQTEGVAYLKMNNITRRGRLDLASVAYVVASAGDREKYGVRVGDVLFNSKNSGDLVGKTTVADLRVDGAVLNENIMRLRFDDRVNPRFAAIWLLGPLARSRIRDGASASTNVAALYQKQLIAFPIWVPPVAEQTQIISEFEALRSRGERIDGEIGQAQRKNAALRRALLTAAFRGLLTAAADQLVPVDLHLAALA